MTMIAPSKAERRTAEAIHGWTRSSVDPALRAAVATLPESMLRIAEYHFGWSDEDGQPAPDAVTGKADRPALAMLTAEAVGAPAAAAVPAAVAVELVHNFALLRDDVIEGDLTRRHRASAWAVFGSSAAILTGDALLTLAFEVVKGHSEAAERMLTEASQNLLAGRAAELVFEQRPRVAIGDCIRMSALKTGALLGCACAVGAAMGSRVEQVSPMREFGELLGLALQFVDDLDGIWGDPAVTGKPLHSDLALHKKSLPVVYALTSRTPAGSELTELYARPELSTVELARAALLLEAAGARRWAEQQADDLVNRALSRLPMAKLTDQGAAELAILADRMTRRPSQRAGG
jgi:geranylgeranyl diphosphate synthase type I